MNSNSSGALVHLRDSGNTVGWEDDFADTFIMFLSLEPDTFLTLIRLGLLKDVVVKLTLACRVVIGRGSIDKKIQIGGSEFRLFVLINLK